jgi:hypothetical protein
LASVGGLASMWGLGPPRGLPPLHPDLLVAGTPPGSSPAALPRQERSQVIEWASRLLRVAVVAPSMVAIATPEPPEVAEIDSVAACVESVTFR